MLTEYSSRWDEFEKGLKVVQETEKPFLLEDGTVMFLDRDTRFRESLEDYMNWRDDTLNSAIPVLKNESSSITGDAQKDKWEKHFTSKGQKALKKILDLVPKDNKTPKLRMFAESIATQESAFFAKLANIPLARFQGTAQEHMREFEKEKILLEGKWKFLLDKDRMGPLYQFIYHNLWMKILLAHP